jgi:hypothetical protein
MAARKYVVLALDLVAVASAWLGSPQFVRAALDVFAIDSSQSYLTASGTSTFGAVVEQAPGSLTASRWFGRSSIREVSTSSHRAPSGNCRRARLPGEGPLNPPAKGIRSCGRLDTSPQARTIRIFSLA